MTITSITSKDNQYVKHMTRLAADAKYRRECGEYLCEGEKLLREALRDGVTLAAVIFPADAAGLRDEALIAMLPPDCKLIAVKANIYNGVSILETPSAPLFVCKMPEHKGGASGSVIALDAVQDPGNVGTVIRTADAFSVKEVWLLEGTADPYQPKAVRAAMGSIFRVPVRRASAEEFFAAMDDRRVYAAALADDAADIRKTALANAAVIIGNEGRGVRPENISRCDGSVIIPMTGRAESLNAAVAAAIIMWEMSECR